MAMAEKTTAPRTRTRRTPAGRSTGPPASRTTATVAPATRKAAPAKRAAAPASRTTTPVAPAKRRETVTLAIPVPTITVRRVGLPVSRTALPAGPASMASTVARRLPQSGRLLYYIGLGALAALDVVAWPVAAAIGGGVWIASRSRATARS
jgi:hypothetical protein